MFTKSRKVAKLFFTVTFGGLMMYILLAFYSLHKAFQLNLETRHQKDIELSKRNFNQDLKYILIETKYPASVTFPEGEKVFIDYQCPHFNCFMTTNERLLKSKKEFDAVLINVTDLTHMMLPMSRPEKQRYIFYGMEPSDQIPICNPDADNFFNYTWSYKLKSDIVSPFFTVRDVNGTTVAPSLYASWSMAMPKSSLRREELLQLKFKSRAVAMVVKSCKDKDGRIFARRLGLALKAHSEELHILGCDTYPLEESGRLIAKKYYFVLVTTGGAAQDYVTDNVLKAYWNSAVPIIKARADLTKFLPPGSFVNAHLQTPEQIAAIVHYSILNPSVYRMFFKWRNYYTFHKREEFDGVCKLCELLNGGRIYSNSSAHLREWWGLTSANRIKCEGR